MFVIAKVDVRDIRQFGDIRTAYINCVCDNGLMGEGSENRSFNQASPWGDGQIALKGAEQLQEREELYLVFSHGEGRIVPEALAGCPIRCVAITDFGGTSKNVEWCNSGRDKHLGGEVLDGSTDVDRFNLKMAIDNPRASVEFEAGADDGWLHVFRVAEHNMDEALAAMHRAYLPGEAIVGEAAPDPSR